MWLIQDSLLYDVSLYALASDSELSYTGTRRAARRFEKFLNNIWLYIKNLVLWLYRVLST